MNEVRDLGHGIFRIDACGENHPFPRYSYLVTEADTGALIDPGPVEDFATTQELLRSILDRKSVV